MPQVPPFLLLQAPHDSLVPGGGAPSGVVVPERDVVAVAVGYTNRRGGGGGSAGAEELEDGPADGTAGWRLGGGGGGTGRSVIAPFQVAKVART